MSKNDVANRNKFHVVSGKNNINMSCQSTAAPFQTFFHLPYSITHHVYRMHIATVHMDHNTKQTIVCSLLRGIGVWLPSFVTRLQPDGATQRHNLSLSPDITLLILRYDLSFAGLFICHKRD